MRSEGIVETAANATAPNDRRIYGIAVAQVIDNRDLTGQGRVQVRLPWLPGVEPWARVAVLTAGRNQGTYFIPQEGDEVLVAFNHGDVREPYVIGCVWNSLDFSPALAPTDARTKRIIRTPLGHEIVFDDQAQSITITSAAQHKIAISPEKIEVSLALGMASLTLDGSGSVAVQAAQRIELKAPSITIEGLTVDVRGSVSAQINGGATCSIQAGLVRIN